VARLRNWTFVIWGALHGIFLSINHIWTNRARPLPTGLAWALTFLATTGAWVFFRATTLKRAGLIFASMAGMHGFAWSASHLSIGGAEARQIAAGLVLVLFGPNRQAIMAWRWPSDYLYAGAFAILAGVSIMSMSNPPPFIYFQF